MSIKTKIKTKTLSQLDKPNMYFVYIINDKHISWDFCMRVMVDIFYKSQEEASAITDDILTNGEGLCGVYIYEIAETKAKIVEKLANNERLSMRCLLEEV